MDEETKDRAIEIAQEATRLHQAHLKGYTLQQVRDQRMAWLRMHAPETWRATVLMLAEMTYQHEAVAS